ncbi:hypothetical protein ABK040_008668 [Willaertia magna]
MSEQQQQQQDSVPEQCPGVESNQAGKTNACQGCPNQSLCSTGTMKETIEKETKEIKESLKTIKHKLLILSGKGGVGKSTISSQLALSLSFLNENQQIGVLDIDLCGPSIPTMFNLEGHQLRQSNLGWTPVYYEDNLAIISIGFMLPNKDDAVIWRGPKKNGLIKQFLKDVYWGDYLDYLIIDTPPGTSDEHLTICNYLKHTNLDGAIIVTTPQDVSCNDVKREINFCRKVGIPILGLVENMNGFICPKCNHESIIFHPTSGGGKQLALDYQIEYLGSLSLDPIIMNACEKGMCILKEYPNSLVANQLQGIINNLLKQLVVKK